MAESLTNAAAAPTGRDSPPPDRSELDGRSQLIPRRRIQAATWAAVAAVIAGTAVRVWFLLTPAGSLLDADQAATGLMARRMLHGQDFYTYFAGQNYNAAIEQYLQTAMYWLLPIPETPFTLRLVPVFLGALVTWFIYLVGARMLPNRWLAAMAAMLFAFGPFHNVLKGTHSDGAYPSTQLLVVVGLDAALRLRGDGSRRDVLWSALLGLVTGLTIWCGLTGLFVLVPVALWAAPLVFRSWYAVGAGTLAAVAGASPTLAWLWSTGTFPGPGPQPPVSLRDRMINVFGVLTREFIGVGQISGRPGWPLKLQYLALVVVLGGWLIAVIRRRQGILALLTFQTRWGRKPVDILLVAVALGWIGLAVSHYSWYTETPRYLFVLYPLYPLLLAACVPVRAARSVTVVTAATLTVVFVVSSLVQLTTYRAAGPREETYRKVAAALVAAGQTNVYGDYWRVIPLEYFSPDVQINAAPLGVGGGKFPEEHAQVDNAPTFAYIADAADLKAKKGIAAELRRRNISFTPTVIDSLVIYTDLSRYPKPWDIGLGQKGPPGPGG